MSSRTDDARDDAHAREAADMTQPAAGDCREPARNARTHISRDDSDRAQSRTDALRIQEAGHHRPLAARMKSGQATRAIEEALADPQVIAAAEWLGSHPPGARLPDYLDHGFDLDEALDELERERGRFDT